MYIATLYIIFAAISTVCNLAAQAATVRIYSGPLPIPVSVIMGTGIGLVVKYLLDKKYIFRFVPKSKAHDARTFIVYVCMGLATTTIFWGSEFGFQWMFHTEPARMTGGALGLAVGYLVKYRLDKKFVFGSANLVV